MSLHGLNFQRAEYGPTPIALDHCKWCEREIAGDFFRANGELICTVCVERTRAVLPKDTRAVFWKTTGTGLAAALGSGLAYLLLLRILHEFHGGYGTAFGAIAVGYAIGRAMRTAAKGAGGRRYQVAGVLLAYAAITPALAIQLLGVEGVPAWAYPFLLLTPFANMVFGRFQLGLLELFIVGIAARWTWAMLRAPHLKITGPEKIQISATTSLGN